MAEIKRQEYVQGSRFALTTLLVVALLTALGGCGKPSQLTAEAVIQKAYVNTAEVGSLRYSGIITRIEGSTTTESVAEGEQVFPDRQHTKFTGGAINEDYELFLIGNKSYLKQGQDQEWRVKQASRVVDLREPSPPLVYLDFLVDLVRLEDAEIDGVKCLRYQARVDIGSWTAHVLSRLEAVGEQARERVREQMGQLILALEVWIGEPDYLVRRIELDETFSGSDDEPPYSMHTIADYYDFNEPIDIRPPDVGS